MVDTLMIFNELNFFFLIDIYFLVFCLLIVILFGSLIQNKKISNQMFILFLWCCFILFLIKISQYNLIPNNCFISSVLAIFFLFLFGFISRSFFKKNSVISFEFIILLFFLLLSILILFQSNDLFVWFLCLELQSFSLYSLAGYRNNRSFLQSEGSLKYFIFGSLASSFFIFGISILYLNTATVNYEELLMLSFFENSFQFYLGIFFILIGLFLKLGVAPFHIWLPEVYFSVSSIVTFLFILIPKIPLLHLLFLFFSFNHLMIFNEVVISMIVLGFIIGGLMAFKQTNYKKFMAFSSIFNNSFFLTALLLNSSFSYFGLYSYLFVYQILIVLLFIPFLFLKNLDHGLILMNLRSLVVLKKTNKMIALLFSFSLFSLAGIPPFFGFFPKLVLFLAVADRNYFFILVLFIFFSVLSCYYYIRLIKIVFFGKKLYSLLTQDIPKEIAILFMIFSVVNLLFFFFPSIYFSLMFLLSL